MQKFISFFAIAGLLLIVSCNSSTKTSGDPKQVLTEFFEALSKKDMVTAKKLATQDSEGMINMMQMSIKNMDAPQSSEQFDLKKLSIGDAVIEGNEAKVPVTKKDDAETMNFILQKENGDWKVAFNFETLARMAQEKMQEKGMNIPNVDSLLNTIPKGHVEKAEKALDSILKNSKELSKDKIDEARKILDSISKSRPHE